jgi:hypothetical protein
MRASAAALRWLNQAARRARLRARNDRSVVHWSHIPLAGCDDELGFFHQWPVEQD